MRGLVILRTHCRIAEQQNSGQMRCLGWMFFELGFHLLSLSGFEAGNKPEDGLLFCLEHHISIKTNASPMWGNICEIRSTQIDSFS